MSKTSSFPTPRSAVATSAAAGVAVALMLAVVGDNAISAQDKYTVQVPDGLAFSEFFGFEDWPTVAVSQAGDLIEVILANPVMIDAYRAGIPGNGEPFPDGSKLAKIHWNAKKSAEAPDPTNVPLFCYLISSTANAPTICGAVINFIQTAYIATAYTEPCWRPPIRAAQHMNLIAVDRENVPFSNAEDDCCVAGCCTNGYAAVS